MMDDKPIRVHLVDEDYLFHLGVKSVLAGLEYVVLEAVSRTVDQAVAAVVASDPDIVLMDRKLAGMDAIAAIRAIVDQAPRTKVVMLSAETDRGSMIEAYQAGAGSYLSRTQMTEDLGPALRMIHRGAAVFSMPLASTRLQSPKAPENAEKRVLKTKLTSRDRRLLARVAAGKTNAEIGRDLHLSEATIKAQLTGIMKGLNVCNRVQLAVLAVRCGLVDIPPPQTPKAQ